MTRGNRSYSLSDKIWDKNVVSDDMVRALDAAELADYVRHELGVRSVPRVDVDRLIAFGIQLARAGRTDADEAAVAWLEAQPTPNRLDAVAALFAGLWSSHDRGAAVDPRHVETLIRAREELPPNPDVENSVVLALREILRSDAPADLKRRVVEAFRAALDRTEPPIDEFNRRLMERALAKTTDDLTRRM